jgi:hypothetical protein
MMLAIRSAVDKLASNSKPLSSLSGLTGIRYINPTNESTGSNAILDVPKSTAPRRSSATDFGEIGLQLPVLESRGRQVRRPSIRKAVSRAK